MAQNRDMPEKVSVATAKRSLSELLSKVQCRGDRIVIHKRDRPVAALVSMVDFNALPSRPDTKEDVDRPGAILDCVGLFADFPEWGQIMEEVVASRGRFLPPPVRISKAPHSRKSR
jgi:prevent-host-death family protein